MHSMNTLETRQKLGADQKTQMSRNSVIMRLEFKATFLTLWIIQADFLTGKYCGITLQMIKFQKSNGRKLKYINSITQVASFSILLFFSSTSRILSLLLYYYNTSTSILRRYAEDQISTNFHVISTYFCRCNFDGRKSTLFPRTFFDVILMAKKSTLFPRTFFGVTSLVKKSTMFPRTCFHVISLVEISTVFLLTFFDVILMVEKSTLLASTFFDEIWMSQIST